MYNERQMYLNYIPIYIYIHRVLGEHDKRITLYKY